MTKVLKVDASATTAYVDKDLGSDQADVWMTATVYIDAASLAAWIAFPTQAILFNLLASDDATFTDLAVVDPVGAAAEWETNWVGPAGTASAGAWFLLELHRVAGGADELYVDGAAVITNTEATATQTRFARVGIDVNGNAISPSLVYFNNVKVGTSRGGSQLFSDDFESGNLSAWTTTSGDVSVVSDPFPPPATPATIVRRRFFLSRQNQGLTVRMQQQGSSAQTEIYLLEYSVRTLDPGGGPGA